MVISKNDDEEIRKRIEKLIDDSEQQEALFNTIKNNPALKKHLLEMKSDESFNYKSFSSGTPSYTSSSPITVSKSRTNSNYIGNAQNFSSSKKGCFIATAAYGSPFADNVVVLKSFRDQYLQKTRPGRLFIATYYMISPGISVYVARHPAFKSIVKSILKPLVWLCKQRNYE